MANDKNKKSIDKVKIKGKFDKSDFLKRLEKVAERNGMSCEELIAAGLKHYLSEANKEAEGKKGE